MELDYKAIIKRIKADPTQERLAEIVKISPNTYVTLKLAPPASV